MCPCGMLPAHVCVSNVRVSCKLWPLTQEQHPGTLHYGVIVNDCIPNSNTKRPCHHPERVVLLLAGQPK